MNKPPTETALLSYEEFLQQYVLNRARGHNGGLDASAAAQSAEYAWQLIKKLVAKEQQAARV